ncbi:MAG: winged helix-turn-helix domain-containing protein [bacterium]|nr:winged helix-turn-helix domain-containing protein [bacterium]
MLEHLFGSKTRVKLLQLFLGNPGGMFYVREIARRIGAQIHAVRRELENLEHLGIIAATTPPESAVGGLRERQRKYYTIDEGFFLIEELRSLVLKSQFLLEAEFKRRIQRLGSLRYFALLGLFIGEQDAPVDVFLVGTIHRERLVQLMKQFEREIGGTVNYTVMTVREFNYRKSIGDRFLYDILGGKKISVIDELTEQAPVERVAVH